MKKLIFLIIVFNSFFILKAQYADLRSILDPQINNSVITIPKNTYTLNLIGKDSYRFNNLRNVTIDFQGSTVVSNRQSQSFQFYNCENVVFKNMILEYDPPCSTQGTITNLTADKRTWTIKLHDGYPSTDIDVKYRIQVYDPQTRELIKNYSTVSASTYTNLGDRTIQFTTDRTNNTPVNLGQYVVMNVVAQGTVNPHAIFVNSCKDLTLDNVTIYDSPTFSILEYDSHNSHYLNCTLTRKPFDPKYTIQPLRAGVVDGIHSKYATKGPTIENCRIEYMGDDCIAINGDYYVVYDINETTKNAYILTSSNSSYNVKLKTGDSIAVIKNDGSILATPRYANSVIYSPIQPTSAQKQNALSKVGNLSNNSLNYGFVINISDWPSGLNVGDLVYAKNRIGSGFTVRNNHVGHIRSRAILIKASDGIIEGNTIENAAMSGIAIAPEIYWLEAGNSENLIIRNNIIRNCMYDENLYTSQAGALSVVSQSAAGGFAPPGSFKNIVITGNTIEGCPRPSVVLTSIDGVVYANNSINPDLTMIRNHGYNMGVPNNRDIWTYNIMNLSTETNINNKYVEPPFAFFQNNKTIEFKDDLISSPLHLSIYDLSGRSIYNQFIFENKLSLSKLNSGIYIINVNNNYKIYSGKLIIQ